MITEWRRLGLPVKDAAVVVAVSGGADSVALLLSIDELRKKKKLDLRIVAAHFDHKLRGDSVTDLEFVKALTKTRKIELAHGEWKDHAKGNVEQEARRARYRFLKVTAKNVKASFILTGHTMNDQAETVLMNLIRSSGPDGLSGMMPLKPLAVEIANTDKQEPMLPFAEPMLQLARPMLGWATRSDTENFCRENSVEFCLDPMNEDLTFRRVWIRKTLIPLLEEVNPKIVSALCRTAELLRIEAGTTARAEPDTNGLKLKDLRQMEENARLSAIRAWLKEKRGNLRGLQLVHIQAISDLADSRKSGRVAELPGGGRVVKQSGSLVFSRIKVEKSEARA